MPTGQRFIAVGEDGVEGQREADGVTGLFVVVAVGVGDDEVFAHRRGKNPLVLLVEVDELAPRSIVLVGEGASDGL
ncbi:MAG: hypothetical protein SPK00_01615 [Corynebacterium glucuronolyticum]|nr:hypothetical protein [Corynebacterium glucuronolyticum]MDD7586790.1 hypothetical protein [Mycobacteriaceae bacterium]MDY5833437.1 hypothetical protein [Corynebacterium glucuronolyticum]